MAKFNEFLHCFSDDSTMLWRESILEHPQWFGSFLQFNVVSGMLSGWLGGWQLVSEYVSVVFKEFLEVRVVAFYSILLVEFFCFVDVGFFFGYSINLEELHLITFVFPDLTKFLHSYDLVGFGVVGLDDMGGVLLGNLELLFLPVDLWIFVTEPLVS